MLQTILSLRDFLKDPQEDLKMLPLQIETCLLFKKWEKDEEGILKLHLYVFDSGTNLIGVINEPHYIPNKK